MKFELVDQLVLDENSGIYVYSFNNLNGVNDVLSLINYFQKKYGTLDGFQCSNNYFETKDEFISSFSSEMFNNMTNLIFECKEKFLRFNINKDLNKLMLTYYNTSNKVYDPNEVTYYERDGQIIKHDKNYNTFSILDENNNWYISPSTFEDFDDFFAEFKEIDFNEEKIRKKSVN